MYRPVATPLSTIAPTSIGTRTAIARGSGSRASVASMTRPITTTLETVPRPSRWRRGIHSSSTAAPAAIVTVPIVSPVRSATPWWKTPHGSSPRPARTISAALAP